MDPYNHYDFVGKAFISHIDEWATHPSFKKSVCCFFSRQYSIMCWEAISNNLVKLAGEMWLDTEIFPFFYTQKKKNLEAWSVSDTEEPSVCYSKLQGTMIYTYTVDI